MSQESGGEALKYGDNRYGFHTNASISEKAGVSPEFVHSKVYVLVNNLKLKTDKARCLRSDDPDYASAVEVLEKCLLGIQNGVDNKISQQRVSEKEGVEPARSSYSSPSF